MVGFGKTLLCVQIQKVDHCHPVDARLKKPARNVAVGRGKQPHCRLVKAQIVSLSVRK